MIEDIRHEVMWLCRQKRGTFYPIDIAEQLGLDHGAVTVAMKQLAEAGQLSAKPCELMLDYEG